MFGVFGGKILHQVTTVGEKPDTDEYSQDGVTAE